MPWYKSGHDGLADDIADSHQPTVNRLWMPKGASKTVLFLDDAAFRFWEHGLYMDGSWKNWFICLSKNLSQDCPLCDDGNKPYFIGFFTIIDRTGYKRRDGKEVKDQKLLLPAKGPILEKLLRQSEKRSGLAGCVFEVVRGSGEKSSSVGDDYDFIEKLTDVAGAFPGVDITPYNYEEQFKPLDADKMKKIISKAHAVKDDTEDVPY